MSRGWDYRPPSRASRWPGNAPRLESWRAKGRAAPGRRFPKLAAAPDAAAAETIVTAPDRWRAGPIQEPVEIAVVRRPLRSRSAIPSAAAAAGGVGVIGQILTLLAELTALRQSKAVADGRRVACPVRAGHGLGGWWARQDSNLRQRRYERRVLTAELRAPGQGSRRQAAASTRSAGSPRFGRVMPFRCGSGQPAHDSRDTPDRGRDTPRPGGARLATPARPSRARSGPGPLSCRGSCAACASGSGA